MKQVLGILGVVALLAVVPNAMAFHGSAYNAHGIATRGNNVYHTDVSWTWSQTFIVKITNPLTGQVLVNSQFPGAESLFYGGPAASRWEIFIYGGWDTSTNGQTFKISGFQQILLTPQTQTMLYTGNYEDYTLVLYVDGNLPA